MAIGRDAAKRILTKSATEAGLRGKSLAWFVGWGTSWLTPWTRERAYSTASITVMARNAAGHAAHAFRKEAA